ncbi:hypothetical protein O9992_20480 [Vibrio lentus]|nr:hypothetical protein [Vibrio lentus]
MRLYAVSLRSSISSKTVSNGNQTNAPSSEGNGMYVVVQPIVRRYVGNILRCSLVGKQLNTETYLQCWGSYFYSRGRIWPYCRELGERIIELVCRAKITLEQGLGYKIKLGINCSAHELSDSKRYLAYLTKTIKQYNFEANEFCYRVDRNRIAFTNT